jgi:quercetin dioxygenase-like cupin family protein
MKISTLILAAAVATLAPVLPVVAASTTAPGASAEGVTQAFRQAITNVPGKTLTGVVVDYAPGQKSPPHRHGNSFVLAYVLSGSIRSQVNDGKEHVFHAGESWSENPGDHHTMSENASDTEPARLLAIFVADSSEHTLVTWDKK